MPTRDIAWPEGAPCWVDCQVDDPAAAGKFYSELLGWDILGSPPEAGGYLMGMKDNRAAAGIGPKPPMGGPMPCVWTTYFASDDADATVAVLGDRECHCGRSAGRVSAARFAVPVVLLGSVDERVRGLVCASCGPKRAGESVALGVGQVASSRLRHPRTSDGASGVWPMSVDVVSV